MQTLKELVNQGKVRYLGLSECNGALLRKAHAIHPISAIQVCVCVMYVDPVLLHKLSLLPQTVCCCHLPPLSSPASPHTRRTQPILP